MTLSWIDLVNFAFPVIGLTVVLLGLLMNTSASYMHWESRRFFFALFSVMALYIASDLVELTFMQLVGQASRSSSTEASNTRSPCISRISSSRYPRAQYML